jgi:hypothetical protein
MKKIFLVAAGLLVGAAILVAQTTSTPRVDRREKKQERRIKQGEKSGELTHHEAKTLNKREAKIEKDEAKAKSDGVVTPKEHHKLTHEQNSTSRAIARKKHNARTK